MKKRIQWTLARLCGLVLAGAAGAAGPATVRAELWHGGGYVDGARAGFVSEKGEWAFLVNYQGMVYLPLRTAGTWMGNIRGDLTIIQEAVEREKTMLTDLFDMECRDGKLVPLERKK